MRGLLHPPMINPRNRTAGIDIDGGERDGHMRVVIQRVMEASVTLRETGERRSIGPGLVVLLGIGHNDSKADAEYLAEKIVSLRIFNDDEGKMNRGIDEVEGSGILIISQVTLLGDARKGRRPSFIAAAPPSIAVPLYEDFTAAVRRRLANVKTGEFGADMLVNIANDGPVTLTIESLPSAG
jgi:D-tyrosyl-tRNA(Tyr) deacylase